MTTLISRASTIAALAAMCGAAQAQMPPADAIDEAEPELRRYTVEMIVFEYAGTAAGGSELFMPDEPPVVEKPEELVFGDPTTPGLAIEADDAILAVDLGEAEDELPPEPEELEEIPIHLMLTELEVLEASEFALPEIYEKLETLDAYRPLMRAAWTQVTREKELTKPLRLRRVGNAPLKLDGELMLYLGRYLHLVVDLALDGGDPASTVVVGDEVRYFGDTPRRETAFTSFGQPALPVTYRINEDRIFRNGELRYYDHPKFGVLARITRVEEAEEELETDEEFLLPGVSGPR